MSSLTGRLFYVPSSAVSDLHGLKDRLLSEGAVVTEFTTIPNLEEAQEEAEAILLLDFLNKAEVSLDFLRTLNKDGVSDTVTTFALVPESTTAAAKEALNYGAADILTLTDDIEVSLKRVKTVLGESFSTSATPDAVTFKTTTAETSANNARIFFVEDDALLHTLLKTKFEESQFTCAFASEGKGLIEKLATFKPHAIILDIMLPGANGLDILEQIKSDSRLKDIPVVMFSNRDEQPDRQRAIHLGAVDFYVKALTDLTDLVNRMRELTAKIPTNTTVR